MLVENILHYKCYTYFLKYDYQNEVKSLIENKNTDKKIEKHTKFPSTIRPFHDQLHFPPTQLHVPWIVRCVPWDAGSWGTASGTGPAPPVLCWPRIPWRWCRAWWRWGTPSPGLASQTTSYPGMTGAPQTPPQSLGNGPASCMLPGMVAVEKLCFKSIVFKLL